MICSLSTLKENDVKTITGLEKKLGKTLLAFSCHDLNAGKLSEAELAEVQMLEKKMGLSLVAVN
jgi:hypothetical protein